MGLRFLAEGPYARLLTCDLDSMAALAATVIERGTVLLAENEHEGPIGMLGALVQPHFLSGDLVASEICWWVSPEHRGGLMAVRLLREAEKWATAQGATALQMVAPDDRVGAFYAKVGYELVERSYYKRLPA